MRCRVCGRPLKEPQSIALRIGPVCQGRKTKAQQKAAQLALPLKVSQPSATHSEPDAAGTIIPNSKG